MRTYLLMCLFVLATSCAHPGAHHGGAHHNPMMHLDKDKDGQVTKAEWSGHFDEIDADKSGSITKEEFHAFRKAHHQGGKDGCGCADCQGGKGCKNCEDGKPCACEHKDCAHGHHGGGKCPDCKDKENP